MMDVKDFGRVAVALMAVVLVPACSSGSNHEAPRASSESTGPAVSTTDQDIESFPFDPGGDHVPLGTPIVYPTDPPVSGPHYEEFVAEGGFYTYTVPPPYLVHSLEHGGVVIYYNDQVTPDQLSHLRDLANQHLGRYAQVVVVPRSDATYPIILTAWTHWLRLTSYDASRIDGFMTLFLDQGPEHAPM
jgi:Protein of unknown function (DUF3105)